MTQKIGELLAMKLFNLLMEAIHASILIVTFLAIVKEPIPNTLSVATRHIILAIKIICTFLLELFLGRAF